MKIIQITDLHIGKADESTQNVDVRANFINMLKKVGDAKPDLLVITGDLCFDQPAAEIYQWIHEQLSQFPIPYLVIAGNHDDSKMMADILGFEAMVTNDELFYQKKWGEWTCLFLDSAVSTLSDNQYQFIEEKLAAVENNCLVFIHHPPAKCGVPFMDDKYSFQEIEKLQQQFSKSKKVLNIFCGHYHVDKLVQTNNLNIHITPSCYMQIDQDSDTFKLDHYRIGYREIELLDDGLLTSVHYLT